MSIRAAVKRVTEHMLLGVASSAPSRRSRTGALILAYHNVLPPGESPAGDASLHISFDRFRRHLDLLQSRTRLIPLDEAVGVVQSGEGPAVAITFDDAYAGAMEYGLREIADRGVPCSVFVCPGMLAGEPFWWDALTPVGAQGLELPVREHALWTLGGRQGDVAFWARDRGASWQVVPDYARAAPEAVLLAAARMDGVTFGSHTWSHVNLGRCTEDEVAEELRRPLAWLAERGLRTTPILAYPYGIPPVRPEDSMLAAGHRDAVVISGGWYVDGRSRRWHVPRYNVAAGLSVEGLGIRLAGWLGSR